MIERKRPAGFVLFAGSPDDDAMVEAARDYIRSHGLTREMVKMGRVDGRMIVVEARMPIVMRENGEAACI